MSRGRRHQTCGPTDGVWGRRFHFLGAGAFAHVLLQGTGDAEGHVTQPAFHGFLACPAVRLHMAGQLAGLRAAVRTQLALVRLLAGVRPPVDG